MDTEVHEVITCKLHAMTEPILYRASYPPKRSTSIKSIQSILIVYSLPQAMPWHRSPLARKVSIWRHPPVALWLLVASPPGPLGAAKRPWRRCPTRPWPPPRAKSSETSWLGKWALGGSWAKEDWNKQPGIHGIKHWKQRRPNMVQELWSHMMSRYIHSQAAAGLAISSFTRSFTNITAWLACPILSSLLERDRNGCKANINQTELQPQVLRTNSSHSLRLRLGRCVDIQSYPLTVGLRSWNAL